MTKNSKPKRVGVTVRVVRLPHGMDLPLPDHQSPLSAGLDLVAAVGWDAPVALLPGSRTLVPTGLQIELPEGYEGQVRPRSGLALSSGITVLNSPGTIDADYRGEVGVLLVNLGGAPFEIRRGERIAQLVVAPVERVSLVEVETLAESERGAGGFGSTRQSTKLAEKEPAKSKAGKAAVKKAAKKAPVKKPARKRRS